MRRVRPQRARRGGTPPAALQTWSHPDGNDQVGLFIGVTTMDFTLYFSGSLFIGCHEGYGSTKVVVVGVVVVVFRVSAGSSARIRPSCRGPHRD